MTTVPATRAHEAKATDCTDSSAVDKRCSKHSARRLTEPRAMAGHRHPKRPVDDAGLTERVCAPNLAPFEGYQQKA
jgi:hypothetical protein